MQLNGNSAYPEGEALEAQIASRHRSGRVWRVLFQISTVVGIIALTALLYNITNQTMGRVAVINEVDPETLAIEYRQVEMLQAATAVSDEEELLAARIAADANAVGFLTASAYEQNQEGLKPVTVAGESDVNDLVIVTSAQNQFLNEVTRPQLQQLFSSAQRWSDVDPSWPEAAIQRYIPDASTSALAAFASAVMETELSQLPREVLVSILASNVSSGVGRRLEREQRFFENALIFEDPEVYRQLCASGDAPEGCTSGPRSDSDIYRIVVERVVQPDIVRTWLLSESLLERAQIEAQAQEQFPEARLEFRTWLSPGFVSSPQSSQPEIAGVRTALLGSLWVIAITIIFSFPIGVGAAIYLEEYATDNRINRFIQTNINNLAGVPSIIYGMLGLAIFVRLLAGITSGAVFGGSEITENGRTILSAGLTLGLLILPIIIINAQEAIRAVPGSLRQASYGLGATKWQTIWSHVLPNALPGILTGSILSISRAIGETAPLVVIGASTFITVDPSGPFSKFTTLPIQIYQWTARPQGEFRNIAAAAIIVLLILLLSLNAIAVILRNRFSKRLV